MGDMDEQLTYGDHPEAAQAPPVQPGAAQDTSGLTFGDHPGVAAQPAAQSGPGEKEKAFLNSHPTGYSYMPADPKFPNRPAGVYPTGPGNEWRQHPDQAQTPEDVSGNPGFMERSGLAGIGKLAWDEIKQKANLPMETYQNLQTLYKALDYFKQGDVQKASLLAATIKSNTPDDPIMEAAKELAYKAPLDEAKQAVAAAKEGKISEAIMHAVKATPVGGPIRMAEGLVNNTAEDINNGNVSGLLGTATGIVAPFINPLESLEFGASGKLAEAAEGIEGGEAAAKEIKSSAIRPRMRQIGRAEVPVTALQDNPDAPMLSKVNATRVAANDAEAGQAKFTANKTQPGAVNATNYNLEDVARDRIHDLRKITGDNTPFEHDMTSIAKQGNAMEDEAQKVYQRFDEASDQEVEDWKQKNDIAKAEHEAEQTEAEQKFNEAEQTKKAAAQAKGKAYTPKTFQGEEFEGEEKPETFREMQSKRKSAIMAMKSGDPAAFEAGRKTLEAVEGRMDDFAAAHADTVSTEEYGAANGLRRAADRHEYIGNNIVIDKGTDNIPSSVSPASLKSLPRKFDKRFGIDAFQHYLGPEGLSNYNAIRDVLVDPVQGNKLMAVARKLAGHVGVGGVGAGLGTAIAGPVGGFLGAAAAEGVRYGIGKMAENLLFNPEYGQTVLKAYRSGLAAASHLIKNESGEMTIPGTGTNVPAEGAEVPEAAQAAPEGINKDNIYQGAASRLSGKSFFESAPKEGPDVPTFYSKAEQVIGDKVPNNASGESVKALLKNSGVKDDEMKWAGLDDYLKDKPKVSKADLQEFIRENQIRVEDVDVKGPKPTPAEEAELHKLTMRNAELYNIGDDRTSAQESEYQQNVNRASELEAKFNASDRNTKYGQYTVPGEKSNYQEKLLTLPPKETPEVQAAIKEYDSAFAARQEAYNSSGNNGVDPAVDERFNRAVKVVHDLGQSPSDKYESPHWQDPNVVAHVRYSDRPAVDGKKTLFMEEAQSDWHSAGRHEGYKASPKEINDLNVARDAAADNKHAFLNKVVDRVNKLRETLTPQQRIDYGITQKPFDYEPNSYHSESLVKNAMTPEERAEFKPLYDAHIAARNKVDYANKGRVPDAPFKQSWHELVMKRMLRQAAENGYDRLAWTTGDQQAELYDRAKHIGKVEYDPEQGELTAYDPQGKKVIDGESVEGTEKDLAPYIGHEAAKKLASQIEDYEPSGGFDEDWAYENAAENYSVEHRGGRDDEEPETPQESHDFNTYQAELAKKYGYDPNIVNPDESKWPENRRQLINEVSAKITPEEKEKGLALKRAAEKAEKEQESSHEGGYYYTDGSGYESGPYDSEREAEAEMHEQIRRDVEFERDNHEEEKQDLPSLSGLDLHTGGEFHKLLYDKMIPSFLKKYAKKWGAQVGETEMKGMGEPTVEYHGPDKTVDEIHGLAYGGDKGADGFQLNTNTLGRARDVWRWMSGGYSFKDAMVKLAQSGFKAEDLATALGGKFKETAPNTKVHSIEITPAMKKSVMKEGQPISKAAPPQIDKRKIYQGAENQLA